MLERRAIKLFSRQRYENQGKKGNTLFSELFCFNHISKAIFCSCNQFLEQPKQFNFKDKIDFVFPRAANEDAHSGSNAIHFGRITSFLLFSIEEQFKDRKTRFFSTNTISGNKTVYVSS